MTPIDHRPFMLHVRALCAARAQVKLDLKRQGKVVAHYKAGQITALAQQLLAADRQRMLEEARERIMGSPSWRRAYERAGRKYEMALAKRQATLAKRQQKSSYYS
jgi:hypothetical protein